jgi:3-oxoacyl-[acyl-carrier-protein] synthase III
MAWISGVGLTPYGSLPARDALGWQERAARLALADAGTGPAQVQGLVVGYATTLNHLMPANLLAQTLGLAPELAFGLSVGGATGLAMAARAARIVQSGASSTRVLVVAGENRASGQSRATSTAALPRLAIPTTKCRWGRRSRPSTG